MRFSAKQSILVALPNRLQIWNLVVPDIRRLIASQICFYFHITSQCIATDWAFYLCQYKTECFIDLKLKFNSICQKYLLCRMSEQWWLFFIHNSKYFPHNNLYLEYFPFGEKILPFLEKNEISRVFIKDNNLWYQKVQ